MDNACLVFGDKYFVSYWRNGADNPDCYIGTRIDTENFKANNADKMDIINDPEPMVLLHSGVRVILERDMEEVEIVRIIDDESVLVEDFEANRWRAFVSDIHSVVDECDMDYIDAINCI